MKNNRFLSFLTLLSFIIMLLVSIYPLKNFIHNYFINYEKEVYLGGENIVIDFASSNTTGEVTRSKNYLTVGTMTYIDLDSNYVSIAHSLNGSKNSGNIFVTPVYSVLKSTNKRIGEKDVIINFTKPSGTVNKISDTGVYGKYTDSTKTKTKMFLGMPSEVKKGEAFLYTNIEGSLIKAYKINIEKIIYIRNHHNIYIKIVDEELISKTGGIISGMSGSPIVQDGKIIGSLSHVNNNDPTYGYGIFITNMG